MYHKLLKSIDKSLKKLVESDETRNSEYKDFWECQTYPPIKVLKLTRPSAEVRDKIRKAFPKKTKDYSYKGTAKYSEEPGYMTDIPVTWLDKLGKKFNQKNGTISIIYSNKSVHSFMSKFASKLLDGNCKYSGHLNYITVPRKCKKYVPDIDKKPLKAMGAKETVDPESGNITYSFDMKMEESAYANGFPFSTKSIIKNPDTFLELIDNEIMIAHEENLCITKIHVSPKLHHLIQTKFIASVDITFMPVKLTLLYVGEHAKLATVAYKGIEIVEDKSFDEYSFNSQVEKVNDNTSESWKKEMKKYEYYLVFQKLENEIKCAREHNKKISRIDCSVNFKDYIDNKSPHLIDITDVCPKGCITECGILFDGSGRHYKSTYADEEPNPMCEGSECFIDEVEAVEERKLAKFKNKLDELCIEIEQCIKYKRKVSELVLTEEFNKYCNNQSGSYPDLYCKLIELNPNINIGIQVQGVSQLWHISYDLSDNEKKLHSARTKLRQFIDRANANNERIDLFIMTESLDNYLVDYPLKKLSNGAVFNVTKDYREMLVHTFGKNEFYISSIDKNGLRRF